MCDLRDQLIGRTITGVGLTREAFPDHNPVLLYLTLDNGKALILTRPNFDTEGAWAKVVENDDV